MTPSPRTLGLSLVAFFVAMLALPSFASAQDPGAAAPAAATGGGIQYGQPTGVVGNAAIYARPQAMLGRTMHFRGRTAPNMRVGIQRLDRKLRTWMTETTAVADANGDYVARWKTNHIGVFSMRVVDADNPPSTDGQAHAAGTDGLTVTVYRPAIATWYGPGFYGRKTACGIRLKKSLIGVAHRGLPCGRSVAIYYKGRTLVAPVIDRGPFDHGADWDLTKAAADRLGFTVTDTIGAVSLPAAPVAGSTRRAR